MKRYMVFIFMALMSVEVSKYVYAAAAAEDVEGQQRRQAQKSRQEAKKELTPEQEELGRDLVKACIAGDVEKVKDLIAQGAPLGVYGGGGITALIVSIQKERWDIFNILLNAGADVNQGGGKMGDTPLHEAVQKKESGLPYVVALISAGANVNKPDLLGGNTPLLVAAAMGNDEAIDALIDSGAFVDQQDNEGYSALMAAINWGRYSAVRALILAGANPDVAAELGTTVWKLTDESSELKTVGEKKRMKEVIRQALEEREQRAMAVLGHLPRELTGLVIEDYLTGRKPALAKAGLEEDEEEEKKEAGEEPQYAKESVHTSAEARARVSRRGEGPRLREVPIPNPETGFYD